MTPTVGKCEPGRETMSDVDQQNDNSVVISGMAGLYPDSRSVKDLEDILYNKINPIGSEKKRWNFNHPEAVQYVGIAPDLDRFDAQFFKVHFRLGNSMDPMSRKLLEKTYEAIYDAGLNPSQLSEKKIGVYIGTCFSETEKAVFYDANTRTGLGIAGCNKAMFANRISYWLNAKGPSMSIDEACCSSTAALEQAFLAISRGECEAAIVGGAYLCLHPQSSVHFNRLTKGSKDGKTKSFDQNPNGCAKSEAVNVLFLQKAKDALRIYATVKHVKSEYRQLLLGETGPQFGFNRDPENTAAFLKSFYEEVDISPRDVEYVEAFGAAVAEADKSELESIGKVFCNSRDVPLLVGSVLSNIGYAEAASGISGVIKVLLGYHRGELAGNLHCETPRTDVAALQEGHMKILTDHHEFRRVYAAVNNMSVNGANAHVLLCGYNKLKHLKRYNASIPRLVTFSGRQESSVENLKTHLKSQTLDPEALALLNNIHKYPIPGHLGRGYTILDTNADGETISISEKTVYFDDAQRPLWFVYSGMGSQWATMGAALMNIPIFAKAIYQCQQALEPTGLDIIRIITSKDASIFDNILHSFVGIAAVQIGLTDVLLKLGLVPDKIIGHSVGELGCAYADGCLTAEEMILSAYSRGLVSLETKFIRGSMAAVGLGFDQISKICPPEIEIACHNSSESSTISGPEEAMREFVADLTAKGIFAKEVPCSNIAYHSRYIAEAGPGLLKYLKEVIKNPKPRSDRWLSTSVPKEKWHEPLAKYCSAEYHTNNLLNPVLFEETSKLIPSNAVVVEVAPHGLLQAILKRSLPDTCTNIQLTRRGHPNNVNLVLEAIGKLYLEGFEPDLQALYPKIEFPVSTGTPFLSHLVEWAHDEKWVIPLYSTANRIVGNLCTHVISIHEDDYSYLKDHIIRNKIVLPAAFILVSIWDTLAMVLGLPKKSFNVKFEDFILHSQPILNDQRQVKLNVSLHRGSGRFEVMDDISKVATGFVEKIDKLHSKDIEIPNNTKQLEAKDIYQLLEEREYSYSGEFRSIYSVNDKITEAKLIWNDNWVTLIDGMLQLNTLKQSHIAISNLKKIKSLIIDVNKHHRETMPVENSEKSVNILNASISDITRCGGVIIKDVKFLRSPPLLRNEIVVDGLTFVPRFQSGCDLLTSIDVYLQIVAENINKSKMNVIEIGNNEYNNNCSVGEQMKSLLTECDVDYGIDYRIVSKQNIQLKRNLLTKDVDIVVVQNLSRDDKLCNLLYEVLPTQTFIINEEDTTAAPRVRPSALYSVVAVNNNTSSNSRLELVRWRVTPFVSKPISTFTVRSKSDVPVLTTCRNSLPPLGGLIVVTSYPPIEGLKDLIKKWREELIRNQIRLVMISKPSQKYEDIELPNVDLAFNVLNDNVWGGEYYLHSKGNQIRRHDWMLQNEQIGNMDSLKWVKAPELTTTGNVVTVHFAGINMTDIKTASGAVLKDVDASGYNSYGMDFSGVTESGQRVMGLVENGSAKSKILADLDLMWPVPSHWSLEDAATVPLAYAYIFYCFRLKVINLIKRDWKYSVLIHGGTGALGQAAINISLASGFDVFVTVADKRKKQFLLRLFPQLKENQIGNSRDSSFGDLVLGATGGRGADAVLNNVTTELKDVSLKCCAHFGVTFDPRQIGDLEEFSFGMDFLTRERAYVAVDIHSIFLNKYTKARIHDLMAEGIANGSVRPLTRVTYSADEAPRAFRLLAASQHRGRVLLDLTVTPSPDHDRLTCSPEENHLVLGNSEKLIISVADRLVDRGARKLYIVLSSTPSLLLYKTNIWKNLGVNVTIITQELNGKNAADNIVKQALKHGLLAGVYLMYTKPNFNLIHDLDLATRNLSPNLKHFLIVECDEIMDSKIKQSCMQRVKDGLPSTHLSLKQIYKNNNPVYGHEIMDVIERSMCNAQAVLLPELKPRPCKSIVEDILSIAGIQKMDKNMKMDSTLQDLGVEAEKSHLVKTYLYNTHNVHFDECDITSLTLARVKEIEMISKEIEYSDTDGLETFYKYVDADELLATVEKVYLPTLTNNSELREDEIKEDETCLWIVPGMEGHHNRFQTLCERLKLPAVVLQPGLDYVEENVHHLALRYHKVLQKIINLSKQFYLVGFETGVKVVLELAAILETQGAIGTIYCIGDGPQETARYVDEHLKKYSSEDELQISMIRHMYTLMVKDESSSLEKVERALGNCRTWKERLELSERELLGRVSHSAQYARTLIEAAYSRLTAARRHASAHAPLRLRSQIVLLRASGAHSADVSSLQQYSDQPLIVYDFPTPLSHITEDLRCSAIINRHLSKDIIEEFDSRNICDSYLMGAETGLMIE